MTARTMPLLASVGASLFLAFFVAFAPATRAQEAPAAVPGSIPTPGAPSLEIPESKPVPLTMHQAVQKGRGLLQAIIDARNVKRPSPFPVPNRNSANVSLAVWDRDDDTIVISDFRKTGDELVHLGGPKLPVRVSVSAKINSVYVLPEDTNMLVVGVIYPVFSNAGTVAAPRWVATETVVTPFQQAFYTPDMLAAGSDYLSYLIQDAYDELNEKGIKSRAFPDKLVTEVVDPYLVKSIAIIEHSDVWSLTKPDDQDRAIGRFLVKLALNGENAFGGAVSTAGAAGMVQFIPSTYKLMVTKRTDLDLIADFRTGMADHQNAVKAQVAYIDMDLAGMTMAREAYLKDKSIAAEFLAASYNGGQARVKRAFAAYGTNWSQSAADLRALAVKINGTKAAPLSVIQTASLRTETVGYVAKLKRTYGMLTAGYFATPKAPSGSLPVLEVPETAPTSVAISAVGRICFGDGSCVQ